MFVLVWRLFAVMMWNWHGLWWCWYAALSYIGVPLGCRNLMLMGLVTALACIGVVLMCVGAAVECVGVGRGSGRVID